MKRAKVATQPIPQFVEPCLATLAPAAPEGEEWLHEIKFDGYRLQARIVGGNVQLLTRTGLDWTQRFSDLAKALRGLTCAQVRLKTRTLRALRLGLGADDLF